MQVEQVDFVSVLTQDIARAKQFYGETLGLPIETEGENDMEFTLGQVTLDVFNPASAGQEFAASPAGIAIRVPVKDIGQAKHFYGDLLGLPLNANSPDDDWLEFEAGNVTLAVMTPHTHEYEFSPLPPGALALRVADVAEA